MNGYLVLEYVFILWVVVVKFNTCYGIPMTTSMRAVVV